MGSDGGITGFLGIDDKKFNDVRDENQGVDA